MLEPKRSEALAALLVGAFALTAEPSPATAFSPKRVGELLVLATEWKQSDHGLVWYRRYCVHNVFPNDRKPHVTTGWVVDSETWFRPDAPDILKMLDEEAMRSLAEYLKTGKTDDINICRFSSAEQLPLAWKSFPQHAHHA